MAKIDSPIVGNHFFFAVSGGTIGAETATSESYRPTGAYPRLGNSVSLTVTPTFASPTVVKAPVRGSYKKRKTRYGELGQTLVAPMQDITELLMSALFQAHESLEAGTKVYAPLSQEEPVMGWLRLQQYTAEDASDDINVVEQWVEIVPGSTTFSETPTVIPVTFNVLQNALSTGQFANLDGDPS